MKVLTFVNVTRLVVTVICEKIIETNSKNRKKSVLLNFFIMNNIHMLDISSYTNIHTHIFLSTCDSAWNPPIFIHFEPPLEGLCIKLELNHLLHARVLRFSK